MAERGVRVTAEGRGASARSWLPDINDSGIDRAFAGGPGGAHRARRDPVRPLQSRAGLDLLVQPARTGDGGRPRIPMLPFVRFSGIGLPPPNEAQV
jgi:hypothetical protein